MCFVIVTSLRIVTDGNKETTYLLTYFYFFRVAIETVVSWRQPSKPLNWCKKSGDAPLSSTTILFQMLSVAVQRGNAVSFLCTFPQDYSVILQLLLTVSKCAALCYRVLKIMILILVIILISIISFVLLSCVCITGVLSSLEDDIYLSSSLCSASTSSARWNWVLHYLHVLSLVHEDRS